MGMVDFLDQQKREALGPVNKWYCSQHYGYEVSDPEKLLAYYIKHGGAYNFRKCHWVDAGEISAAEKRCG
jgi:hypothetical protein